MDLFAIGGKVPESSYLFIGDYINCGHHSVETVSLLIALKLTKIGWSCCVEIISPDISAKIMDFTMNAQKNTVLLLCGSASLISSTTFPWLQWSIVKFSAFMVEYRLRLTFRYYQGLNRFSEIPHQEIVADLLWTDPDQHRPKWHVFPKSLEYTFGVEVTKDFNHKNGLKIIARAHQFIMRGYNLMHEGSLVSIFSAPNYCYHCGNHAAFMDLDEHLQPNIVQFEPSPKTREENQAQGYRFPDYFL